MLIEIVADFVCPWCYIGKRRLERALAQRPTSQPEVRWMPFQLDPDTPPGGIDRTIDLLAKFGSAERIRQVNALLEQTAAAEGLSLNLDRIRRTPNTLDAHRLMRHADANGRGGQAMELASALQAAFFRDGRDIGDRAVLAAIAGESGLDADAAAAFLESDADRDTLRQSLASIRQLGIQAVPCFIFNRLYSLSGAQEPGAFLPLLDLAGAEGVVASAAG
ncbi:DsbA family oxidoreductase [Nitrospirillum pindoramense]|uniref:Putative DsbA family dithiol-disulfide isomerase n=1 Tax=Nitrospirillum amazonense TaxID=28077 RepID=A0A560H2D9_9PROT|nr:DsbA family oxidoreductase [Nitrospirillum amazonense]TWB40472.1 putative DsbA family dithiol-disulfide isomerase [Nitrospirillum amazonense]